MNNQTKKDLKESISIMIKSLSAAMATNLDTRKGRDEFFALIQQVALTIKVICNNHIEEKTIEVINKIGHYGKKATECFGKKSLYYCFDEDIIDVGEDTPRWNRSGMTWGTIINMVELADNKARITVEIPK